MSKTFVGKDFIGHEDEGIIAIKNIIEIYKEIEEYHNKSGEIGIDYKIVFAMNDSENYSWRFKNNKEARDECYRVIFKGLVQG